MKINCSRSKVRALTLVEVVVVTATGALLCALLLPPLKKAGSGRQPAACAWNLKAIGLGMRLFSNDHGGRFPWLVPKAEGGSMEYSNSTEVFRHFLAASNELSSPKGLSCPGDKERTRQSDWNAFSNGSLSYFVGLEARASQPTSVLAGDRTMWVGKKPVSGVVELNSTAVPRITKGLHGDFINMVYSDQSVRRLYDTNAKNWILYSNQLPVRLAVP